ncbi:MAG: hypothetical protein DRH24_19785 [Deltaproteobacteria bacterium]|nr:MAG: hypothetical protein DRH24_19785 [Deltaproteobacteria bacterium]
MDFIERRLEDIEKERKKLEIQIAALSRQTDEMDAKIRAYLADRSRNPHPRHFDLIDKVQKFKIPGGLANKSLEGLLDSLQWKVYYAQRAWQQMWQNAEAAQRASKTTADTTKADASEVDMPEGQNQEKSQYSVDTLWEIQQEKLKTYGYDQSIETKSAFRNRMAEDYKRLSKDRRADQEIVMTFDKDEKKCLLGFKE